MAATEKVIPGTSSDLDVLIHSLEFENQQYVKMIEKENQKNQYFQAEEEEKLGVIAELQILISNLEADTKNCHRQLVHNKHTLESLKKSKCVLQAHKDALHKQLDMLQFENNEQLHEFQDTVQMYEKTWMDYEAQYKSLALYHKLESEEEKLAKSQSDHVQWQQKKMDLQSKLQAARDELDFKDWHRFCIKIFSSEKKLGIYGKKEELMDAVREKETLQAKLEEIREKHTSVTSHDSNQGMETDLAGVDRPDTDVGVHNVRVENTMLCRGDGGDIAVTETQKEGLSVERNATTEVEPVPSASDNHDADVTSASDSNLPTVIPLTTPSTEHAEEEMMDENVSSMTREYTCPVRFEPSDRPLSVVTGSVSQARKSSQTTSSYTYSVPQPSLPTTALPRIRVEGLQRPGQELGRAHQNNGPRNVRNPQTSIKPPQISVPLLSVPKPAPRSVPAKIPSVRSAVSSLLSGGRLTEMCKPPTPVMPKLALPKTSFVVAPPSPMPSLRAVRPPGPSHRQMEGSKGGTTETVTMSAPVFSVPMLPKEQVPVRNALPESCVPVTSVAASGIQIPCSARPVDKQPSPSFTGCRPMPRATPLQPITTANGDAPPLCEKDKPPCDGKQEDGQRGFTDSGTQDEDMESDAETAGLSQPLSSTPTNPRLSGGASSQGENTAYSPFNFDRHKQKLNELNDDSDDSFNYQQRHFFSAGDNMVAEDTSINNVTASASTIFNMTFGNTAVDAPETPVASVFRTVTSPASSSPAGQVKPSSHNRDQERSGSFFSFESMDTSESSGGGLSLLSMFGQSEPQSEPAFSFNFGGSAPDSGNSAGFSFSFGGGDTGAAEQSGSVFSLF